MLPRRVWWRETGATFELQDVLREGGQHRAALSVLACEQSVHLLDHLRGEEVIQRGDL